MNAHADRHVNPAAGGPDRVSRVVAANLADPVDPADLDAVDAAIDAWHAAPSQLLRLHEFLGWTYEAYMAWVEQRMPLSLQSTLVTGSNDAAIWSRADLVRQLIAQRSLESEVLELRAFVERVAILLGAAPGNAAWATPDALLPKLQGRLIVAGVRAGVRDFEVTESSYSPGIRRWVEHQKVLAELRAELVRLEGDR